MFDTPFDSHDDRQRFATDDGYAAPIDPPEDLPAQARPDGGGQGLDGDMHDRAARSPRWIVLGLIALVLAASWFLLRGEQAPAVAAPMASVVVAAPLQREVTEWDEYIGRFEASRRVEVRPRVSGQVTAIHFTDGQFVRAGAPLFTIDPRPYRASLAEAQARVASASSALALARSNLARAERLVDEDAIAANEVDRLRAEVRANEAALAAAQATARIRALDVEFTTVRAPIAGRISDRRVDAGNLVAAGSGEAATLLTTINAVDPIHFSFEGSEALFLKARREGLGDAAVEIRLADETGYRWQGRLDFTDNALDPRSGTIRARAVLANPDGFLAPGLFGNMRMATGTTVNALLVPDTAVTTDQTRKLLLVVGQDGTVAAREVELGPLVDGLRVIRNGIRAGDRVVIQGVQMAIPGQKVKATAGTIAAPAPQPSAGAAAPPRAAAAAGATISR